jgi:hypothetical protein
MPFGPAEAFAPEQLAQLYDINVLSTQRVSRAALHQMSLVIIRREPLRIQQGA